MEQNVSLQRFDMLNKSVAEMRMLRWIYGHTRIDRVRNDDIRDRLQLAPTEEKLVCGGINPYTLTAKLGLARIDGFSPPER